MDENSEKLVTGGPSHLYGEGAPHQKTNTRACGLVSQPPVPSQMSQSSQIFNDTERGGYGGVYAPTGTECNNVLYETDEEEFEIVCNTEGGGGGVHAPTGTKCNIVLVTPTVDYETDEEEFTRPRSRMQSFNQISAQAQTPSMRASKCKNTAKQRLQPRVCSGYHLPEYVVVENGTGGQERRGREEEERGGSQEGGQDEEVAREEYVRQEGTGNSKSW